MTAAKRWRAPTEDGGVLVDPPFAEVPRLLEENRRRLAADCLILGRPLREWRKEAMPKSTVACGHQPELFHSGVWVKNFAINGLGRRHGLKPLNLVINTDTIKSTSMRMPVSDPDPANVRIVELPFDEWTGEAQYESRRVINRDLFASFADRAKEIYRGWGFTPLLARVWNHVAKLVALPFWLPEIAECFFAARCAIERDWACVNGEEVLSRVLARIPAIAFIAHVLDDLPRFHAIYNDSVRAYRRDHGLRSHTHPVPDLVANGDLLEAPFWLYDAKSGRRTRLLVRQGVDELALYGGLDAAPISVRPWRVDDFDELANRKLFIQTRALTTTMFARLFLCDLFIHGIGGGIYDELTDTIIRRYFGIEPPHYLVVSGTLRLPLPTFPATPATCRQLQRELRDLHWNPHRYVDAGELAAQREHWRASQPADSAGRRERFRALLALTTQIRQRVPAEEFARREQRLERCERELAANAILQSREYAFCLYPEEKLRPYALNSWTSSNTSTRLAEAEGAS